MTTTQGKNALCSVTVHLSTIDDVKRVTVNLGCGSKETRFTEPNVTEGRGANACGQLTKHTNISREIETRIFSTERQAIEPNAFDHKNNQIRRLTIARITECFRIRLRGDIVDTE
jgi:hypothetical protein